MSSGSNNNNNNSNSNNNKAGSGGGGAAAAAAAMMVPSSSAGPARSPERLVAAQKWLLQCDAVLNTCAVPISATTAVQTRRRVAGEGAAQILKLLGELRAALGDSAEAASPAAAKSVGGAENNNNNNGGGGYQLEKGADALLASAMAEGRGDVFRAECGLEVGGDELRLPDGDALSTATPTVPATATAEVVSRRLQPLQRALASTKELRQIQQYSQLLAAAGKGDALAEAVPTLVKGLQAALEESLRILEHGYATCARSTDDITAWGEWTQPLLRLLGNTLRVAPLERATEEPQERLRRAAFDVKEKQREQEDAVTDGDMVRSEHLYFEATALLEGMRPLYDKLEQVIEAYKKEAAEGPLQQLRTQSTELTSNLAPAMIAREEHLKRRCTADIERLADRREAVRSARNAQRASFSVQMVEWDKLFQLNRQQQDACLQAIEELEQRLRQLTEERTFLVEDRLEAMTQERQREEDAVAFMAFADRQEDVLRRTLLYVEQSLHCAHGISEAVRSGYRHLNRHLQDVVLQGAETRLLEVRKERLEHFRSLYLTLGELQFKKERHVEELNKRIEYYHVQQELAMDTFNPKAREFSKAKKDLLEVKEKMEQQVQLISQKAAQQLEDFKPTEKLLLASGVQFRHPVEDLAEMNALRTQKLLEYHSLMSTMKAEGGDSSGDSSGDSKDAKGGGACAKPAHRLSTAEEQARK
ncbi:putative paraflagellar rod protein [Trypanosoma conorhini]|uniref:Putative paraflagellar rod protein n=1 Tax=Trypanosoma conorhini TaxID=83891 RepID=A0A3R7NYX5_9TRYP|nr:putative paraflagellar rod protein [Trypanosoma conorhini]RNF26010.1 putative paraflagellar rod protein [Trypanosoma conorhini]